MDQQKSNSKGRFATKLTDNELTDCVTYLWQKDTGLPCDIIVDCGKNYEFYNHPLCLYVVQGDSVKPILITKDSKKFEGSEPEEVVSFIKANYCYLRAFANNRIGASKFFEKIEEYKNTFSTL